MDSSRFTGDTLPQCILAHGTRMADTTAMRQKAFGIWKRISWGTVLDEVRAIAAGLTRLQLDQDECVVILGHNEPELFFSEYAIQAMGKTAVCLYPEAAAQELATLIDDCQARVAIAHDQEQCDKLLEIADTVGLRRIVFWDGRGMDSYDDPRLMSLDEVRRLGREALRERPALIDEMIRAGKADDLAIVIYTSGTSGKPKGVMGTHRYLLDCALRWQQVLDARPLADYVSYISPAWATEQYLGLSLGAALPMTINFPENPETVAADTREIGAEFVFFGSRQWEAIVSSTESRMRDAGGLARFAYRWAMDALTRQDKGVFARFQRKLADVMVAAPMRDRLGFTYLRTAVNSGSLLSPEVFKLFHALGVRLRNAYGFTEVGIITATLEDHQSATVGRPLRSAYGSEPLRIRIQDSEIQVRGGVPTAGYYRQPQLMPQRMTEDGWMRSGDAGLINEEGSLVYLDRLEDLRRLSTGEVIAPQFIETRLRLSPYIRDAMVIGDANRAFVGAMIDIDADLVGKWAEERQISFTAHADLSQKQEVVELIRSEIHRINQSLPSHCRVAKFVNLFKSFDADEGELTRSRKIKRNVVEAKYAILIEGIYAGQPVVPCSVEVKLQDGRSRMITSQVTVCALAAA